MPLDIYPPIIQSTQPAFLYTETSYPVYFTLQKISSFDKIGHIQIRLVKQSNNKTIVSIPKYPDGIIYKAPAQIMKETGSKYSIAILNTDLAETWEPGCLYKIQLRVGTTAMFSSVDTFATWKKQQIDNQTFSEWSTVMVVKPITKPDTYIENAEAIDSTDLISTERVESTLTPLFIGISRTIEAEKELVDKYKFDLYKGEKEANDERDLLASSGWLQHDSSADSSDRYRFPLALENEQEYTVFYSIRTVNGYEDAAKPYVFMASKTYLPALKGIEIRVDDQEPYCAENGCLQIYLRTDDATSLSGSYVISRSSDLSNYTVWEDIKYLLFTNRYFDDQVVFQDFTIESGVGYKYAIQQENSAGLRTEPVYTNEGCINFEYSYLYHDDVQLRLQFNQKMSSFKHTVLTSKQDTLGDRYPHLVKNGYAYYAEFPVSGLISFEMDDDRTFLKVDTNGFFYDDQLLIPEDKFQRTGGERLPSDSAGTSDHPYIESELTLNKDLTPNNIFVQRRFREKVEEFLNNFDYKLYKSPTEGNIVVILSNVSLTPNATLGRMLFDFSATAYEVMDNTISNLNEYGIINIGEFQTISSSDITTVFGQLNGIYGDSVDIFSMIKNKEEVSSGEGYKFQLLNIKSFWIERYPKEEYILNKDYDESGEETGEEVRVREVGSGDLVRLNAELSQAKNEGASPEDIAAIEEQIDRYEKIQEKVRSGWYDSNIILSVNDKNILVAPRKIYSLTQPISSFKVVYADYPVIINYIAELNQVEDTEGTVISAIDTSRIWGQLVGVFTETGGILVTGYNADSATINQLPYRVLSGEDIRVIKDANGNVIVDDTGYNVYKTLNIYEAIQEDCRRQVEVLYNVRDGFKLSPSGEWVGDNIVYNFYGITSLNVEAEQNTTLLLGKKEDGSDAIQVKIGEQGKYILNPIDDMVNYISLESPAFILINYKCITSQLIKKE